MTRMIRIETCENCHFKKRIGGFDRQSAYQPRCENPSAVGLDGRFRKLGFTVRSLLNGSPYPEYDGIIPDWCPLEKITLPEDVA